MKPSIHFVLAVSTATCAVLFGCASPSQDGTAESNEALTGAPCTSIAQCQDVIRAAKKAMSADTTSPHVCSLTGTALTPDTSNPALGQAYKDPHNVIWGDPKVDATGKYITVSSAAQAEAQCASIGAELPTRADYQNLFSSLSNTPPARGSYVICSTLADTDVQILPHLTDTSFSPFLWTSTPFELDKTTNWLAEGSRTIAQGGGNVKAGVRCIVRR